MDRCALIDFHQCGAQGGCYERIGEVRGGGVAERGLGIVDQGCKSCCHQAAFLGVIWGEGYIRPV